MSFTGLDEDDTVLAEYDLLHAISVRQCRQRLFTERQEAYVTGVVYTPVSTVDSRQSTVYCIDLGATLDV